MNILISHDSFDNRTTGFHSYEIDDKTEGYYVLANFKADGDFPKELDRKFRITDGILRTIIIRKED